MERQKLTELSVSERQEENEGSRVVNHVGSFSFVCQSRNVENSADKWLITKGQKIERHFSRISRLYTYMKLNFQIFVFSHFVFTIEQGSTLYCYSRFPK